MLLTQSFAWPLISIRDHVTVQNKGLQHRFTGQFTLRAQGVQSSSNAGLLPPLESSPAFDESPRQPTQNEVRDLLLSFNWVPVYHAAAA